MMNEDDRDPVSPHQPQRPHETSAPEGASRSRTRQRPSRKSPVTADERRQIVYLYKHAYGMRAIAKRVLRDRKTVRRTLLEEGYDPAQRTRSVEQALSKLEPFRETIQDKAKKGLTTTRILREIRELGYTGGRTILNEYVRSVRAPLAPKKRAKRRFETRPGQETQVDWTVYTVRIDHRAVRVHALATMLCYSRMGHVHFYPNERESTLLEGLTQSFEAFGGVTLRVVFDSMATVVLGRVGRDRKPLWHPRLLDYSRHYGFEPFLCRVRDPDRKGKDERFLDYLEKDFVRGSEFASFEDLNQRVHQWVDQVANQRIHGTTRRVPAEAWLEERDFLIRLPETRFPVFEETVREVGPASTLSIHGTLYTVPATLANHTVAVRLYAEHFEVLDATGTVAFTRAYVGGHQKGTLQIDAGHYASLPRHSPEAGGERLDELLLRRFPSLAALVEGIRQRMKSLAHVHLRTLWRLAATYDEQAFLRAATRAQDYRRFNAEAVRRILEQHSPASELTVPVPPVGAAARAKALLGEVDPGSLDSYGQLDTVEADESPDSGYPQEEAAGREDDHEG